MNDSNQSNANYLFGGEIVEFNYNGGSNPGSKRLVYVLSTTQKNITVWDFNKSELRTFNRSKISNVRFLDDNEYKVLKLNDLPKATNITGLIYDFDDEGYKVYSNDDEIVAVMSKEKNLLRGYSNGTIFFETNNSHIGLKIIGNKVALLIDDDEYSSATVEDLAKVFNS